MAYIGQALQPGYYWSGTRVCAGPGAARYIGAVQCWEYTRAPSDVFRPTVSYPTQPPQPPPTGGGPQILPPPPTTTGGVGSPPPPTTIGGCGSCRKSSPVLPSDASGQPSAPGAAQGRQAGGDRYPWWVFVLAILILAQVVDNG